MMQRRTVEEIIESAGPIAQFIRHRRKQLGYTQEQLAARIGVGTRFLKELELGKKTARLDKVNQVLAYFGHQVVPGEIPRDDDYDT